MTQYGYEDQYPDLASELKKSQEYAAPLSLPTVSKEEEQRALNDYYFKAHEDEFQNIMKSKHGKDPYILEAGMNVLRSQQIAPRNYATADDLEKLGKEYIEKNEPGFLAGTLQDIVGGASDVPELFARSARALPGGEKAGVNEGGIASKTLSYFDQLKKDNPYLQEQHDPNAWHSGVRSAVTSLVSNAPAMAAGAAIGSVAGPIGTLIGAVAGYALSGASTFALSQYDQTMENLHKNKPDMPMAEKEHIALVDALWEGGGEAASDIVQGVITVGSAGTLSVPGKAAGTMVKIALKDLFKKGFKEGFKSFGKRALGFMAAEVGGEMATGGGQAENAYNAGIGNQRFWDGAKAAFGPASVASLIFLGFGEAGGHLAKRSMAKALENPNSNVNKRLGVAREVEKTIRKSSPELADQWSELSLQAISNGESIPTDSTVLQVEKAEAEKAIQDPAQAFIDQTRADLLAGNITPDHIETMKEQNPSMRSELNGILSEHVTNQISQKLQFDMSQYGLVDQAAPTQDQTTWQPGTEVKQSPKDRLKVKLAGVKDYILPEGYSPAQDAAQAFIDQEAKDEQLRQSPEGGKKLKEDLQNRPPLERLTAELENARGFRLPEGVSPAQDSAGVIDEQLTAEERLRRSPQSAEQLREDLKRRQVGSQGEVETVAEGTEQATWKPGKEADKQSALDRFKTKTSGANMRFQQDRGGLEESTSGVSEKTWTPSKVAGKELYEMSPTGKEYAELPVEEVMRKAFGFAESDIKTISPDKLEVKYSDDYDQAVANQKNSGLSEKKWAESVDLTEPIQLSYEGGKFKIEDGHNRYLAAKILGKDLNVDAVDIKDKPHLTAVKKAIAEGKTVPQETLDLYGLKSEPVKTKSVKVSKSQDKEKESWEMNKSDFVSREQTIGPKAELPKVGTKRIGKDGYVDTLTEVPISDITLERANKINPETVDKYQKTYSNERPVLTLEKDGSIKADDGHHRILADKARKEAKTLAWVRDATDWPRSATHKHQVQKAIDEGKIKRHPDYPELTKTKAGQPKSQPSKTEAKIDRLEKRIADGTDTGTAAKKQQARIDKLKGKSGKAIGKAWVKNQWRPITESREITRKGSKRQGQFQVTLPDGSKTYVQTVKMDSDEAKGNTLFALTPEFQKKADVIKEKLAKGEITEDDYEYQRAALIFGSDLKGGYVRHKEGTRMTVAPGTVYGPVSAKDIRKGKVTVTNTTVNNPLTGKTTVKIYHDNKGNIIIPGPILSENRRVRRNQIKKIVAKNDFAWPWYQDWHNFTSSLGKDMSKEELDKRIKIMGVLSAGNSVGGNLKLYAQVLRRLEKGIRLTGKPDGVSKVDAKKINRIWDGLSNEQEVGEFIATYGPKVGQFIYTGLNPDTKIAVVVDRHMGRIFGYDFGWHPERWWPKIKGQLPKGKFWVGTKVQREIEDDIKWTANKMNIPAGAVQAALWFDARQGDAYLGSYQDYAKVNPKKYLSTKEAKAASEEQRYVVHYGPENITVLRAPDTVEDINPYSRNDVEQRMLAATKENPYQKFNYAYDSGGVEPEAYVRSGKSPYAVKIPVDKIYDSVADPLGFMKTARERIRNDPEFFDPNAPGANTLAGGKANAGKRPLNKAAEVNALVKLLKKGKYKGFSYVGKAPAGKPVQKWVALFDDLKIDSFPSNVQARMSGVVGAKEKVVGNIDDVSKMAQERSRLLVSDIQRVARESYPEVTISKSTPTIAAFDIATEGQMEYGIDVTLKGPVKAIKALLSEAVGVSKSQYAVIMETSPESAIKEGVSEEDSANALTISFGVDKVHSRKDVEKAIRENGLTNYNILESPTGTMTVDMSLGGWESEETNAKMKASLKALFDAIGTGEWGHKSVHSETLGSFEGMDQARENYRGHINEYHGKTRGKEIYERATRSAEERETAIGEQGATDYYRRELAKMGQGKASRPGSNVDRPQVSGKTDGTGDRSGTDNNARTKVKNPLLAAALANAKANAPKTNYLVADQTASGAKLPDARIERLVNKITKTWKNLPNIVIVKTQSEIPDHVINMSSEDAQGARIKGAWYQDKDGSRTVYLVSDNLYTPNDVVNAVTHEVMGHHGLNVAFGEQFDPFLDFVYGKYGDRIAKDLGANYTTSGDLQLTATPPTSGSPSRSRTTPCRPGYGRRSFEQ